VPIGMLPYHQMCSYISPSYALIIYSTAMFVCMP
jgi:hypothetical protein